MNEYVKQKLLERVDELFSSKQIPWFKPWKNVKGIGVNYFSQKKYQGVNRLLLGDGEWATFNQITSHNGKLNKGSKGHIVLCPIISETQVKVEQENGEIKEETRTFAKGFRVSYVYNIKDTDLPSKIQKDFFDHKDANKDVLDAIEKVFALAKEKGIKITEKPSNEAYFSNSNVIELQEVVVPNRSQFENLTMFLKTLLHEIGHATGTKNRLNRHKSIDTVFGSETYAKEELVAEIFAFSCLSEFNLSSPLAEDETVAYLNNWQRYCHENISDFVKASSEADKALQYFLN